MKLQVSVEDRSYNIEIPEEMLSEEGQEFFAKMDDDMDSGWQMGMEFIENPDKIQRCQIAADRLYTALDTENKTLAQLMAAYIVTRLPGVVSVDIDATGDMQLTEFNTGPGEAAGGSYVPGKKLNKIEAMEQAGKDVSKVYKSGKGYKFAVYDRSEDKWMESPPFNTEQEAEAARSKAFKTYFDALTGE
jgi:hypothetical protein